MFKMLIENSFEKTFVGCYINKRLCQLISVPKSRRRYLLLLGMSLLLDLLAGQLVHTVFRQWFMCDNGLMQGLPANSFPHLLMSSTESIVLNLKLIINWLMQNPGGLKLNSVLSSALGNFFLYHIHLWVTYVYMVVPALVGTFHHISAFFPHFPLALQLAILGDLVSILCVHVFCFYAYARRITLSQLSGCRALARLFAGKKYNPLRKRVDSADVRVEHLFLGTIVFTILLFLLPTSTTFFVVFYILRMLAVVVLEIIRKTIALVQWIPYQPSD